MRTEDRVPYWVTDSPLLHAEAKFIRATAVSRSILGSQFVAAWRAQQELSPGSGFANAGGVTATSAVPNRKAPDD